MKIGPEQIRARAKIIAKQHAECDLEAEKQILSLIEEATGEKLPEPFDEKNVRHGAVWVTRSGISKFVIVGGADDFSCVQLNNPEPYVIKSIPSGSARWQLIIAIRDQEKARYLGQYDFAAGLPKEAK